MEREPRLKVRKVGRSLMFTERDYEMLIRAMAWRSPGSDRPPDRLSCIVARATGSDRLTAWERVAGKLDAAERSREVREAQDAG